MYQFKQCSNRTRIFTALKISCLLTQVITEIPDIYLDARCQHVLKHTIFGFYIL